MPFSDTNCITHIMKTPKFILQDLTNYLYVCVLCLILYWFSVVLITLVYSLCCVVHLYKSPDLHAMVVNVLWVFVCVFVCQGILFVQYRTYPQLKFSKHGIDSLTLQDSHQYERK